MEGSGLSRVILAFDETAIPDEWWLLREQILDVPVLGAGGEVADQLGESGPLIGIVRPAAQHEGVDVFRAPGRMWQSCAFSHHLSSL